MSFSKFKIGELRQIAEGFGVDIPAKTSKENLVLLLEEEGITYDMYERFSGAEKEDLEDGMPDPEVDLSNIKTVLVKMERSNPTYQVGNYIFTQQHPYIVMPEWDAQQIFDTNEGFRLANPREVQEYYS